MCMDTFIDVSMRIAVYHCELILVYIYACVCVCAYVRMNVCTFLFMPDLNRDLQVRNKELEACMAALDSKNLDKVKHIPCVVCPRKESRSRNMGKSILESYGY